jgi:hypothetical protein
MRNYADEILFIEIARTERCARRTTIPASNDNCSQPERAKCAPRPVIRARWVLVDGKLELRWSDDCDEPLRCAA